MNAKVAVCCALALGCSKKPTATSAESAAETPAETPPSADPPGANATATLGLLDPNAQAVVGSAAHMKDGVVWLAINSDGAG